ncbi:hypothetical protein ACFVGX_36860 [Streptomyces sp. NPDC127113]|uniref:hypothetical protein n=1 Tax=Streptomyces sp. NPDC127113 TaxID=3345365 RepID=UPI003624CD35
MLTIEVKRHPQGETYFSPWIEDYEDGSGCTFHFHWDDISDEGCAVFREVFTEQGRRWHPRPPGARSGPRIPITMDRRDTLECGAAVAVDDHAEYIAYTARADLISERGARSITQHQSERSPYWERRPARYVFRQRTA